MRTLVIGDAHVDPEHSNERFKALGMYIVETLPDNIVQIGDFLSLDSLDTHDKDNILVREGKRLQDDIKAGKDALMKLTKPMAIYNSHLIHSKKKQYQPNKYWLIGNHEDRAYRYICRNPVLEGFLFEDPSMIGADADGWHIIPYKDYVYIEGVGFTHIPMNKRNNQPIGGEYVARRALEVQEQTVVFGHTHRLVTHDMARNKQGERNLLQAVSVGWFGDYVPSYVQGNEQTLDWWSGLVELTHYAPGQVDIKTISMDRLKAEYL